MAEGREETKDEMMPEEVEAEKLWAPYKEKINGKLAQIAKEAERIRSECSTMPGTHDGRIQVQLGQLALLVLDTQTLLWATIDGCGHLFFFLNVVVNKLTKTKATPEHLREELFRTFEEVLQKVESAKNVEALTLTKTSYIS